MRALARQPILAHRGDPLEAAQLAPVGGHILQATTPELPVETFEREFCQRRSERGLEVLAQTALPGGRPGRAYRRELALDCSTTGKPPEALEVDRKWNDRIVGPQARALIDSPLLEIEIAAQEGQDVRSSPEDTHDAGAVFVGQAFLGLERAEHAARDLRLLDQRNVGAKRIAQKQRGAAAREAGADHQYFHRGYFIADLGECQTAVHLPKGAVGPGCRACTPSGSRQNPTRHISPCISARAALTYDLRKS